MSVSGKGTPIAPARLAVDMGLPTMIGEVSVIPYPSTNRPPVADSHFSMRSAGRLMAPEKENRTPCREILRLADSSRMRV